MKQELLIATALKENLKISVLIIYLKMASSNCIFKKFLSEF